ncbi:hypothetical protein M959_02262, partial [Chaetura pelagica]
PVFKFSSPENTRAVYPYCVREQRTMDLLSHRQHEGTPGPGTYDVDSGYRACLPSSPSITIQGVRRPKRHETGPFLTL